MIPAANAAYPQRLWLLLLGLAPFLVAVFGLLSDETQIWLGDLRVVLCGAVCFLLVWLVRMWIAAVYMATELCTESFCFYASTSVRTEPRATSAKLEKKKHISLMSLQRAGFLTATTE